MQPGCCQVEALVSVDERGQLVLPKELRKKAGINAGDKLAVASWNFNNQVSCLFLLKAEDLANIVKDMLGPIVNEIKK
jgi:AbrB family looped-hinge helix DNA binding protein